MEALLQTALANVLVATLLALAATSATRLRSWPALAHALWVLALLKLVTPPLFEVPVRLPSLSRAAVPEPATSPAREGAAAGVAESASWVSGREPAAPAPPVSGAVPASRDASSVDVLATLTWIWGLGAVLVFSVSGYRTLRFAQLLRRSRTPSGLLERQASALARRLGIRRAPAVYLVPGSVPPMLWAIGSRAGIYLPQDLLENLTARQRIAVLLHELAHLRRGDHWVRPLELVVRAIYWWNPLVWWSCRQLRVVEEECCDAWVVWALPRASRAYADALIETVRFLSDARTILPAAASGLGRVQNLHRRLTMIMEKTTHRSLSRFGRLVTFAVAVAALPALPALAQEGEKRLQKELRAFIEQNAGNPERVKELCNELDVKRARHREQGDAESEREAAAGQQFLVEWLEKHAAEQRQQEKTAQGDPERLVRALKRAIQALKESDQREEAELLERHAEKIKKGSEQGPLTVRHERGGFETPASTLEQLMKDPAAMQRFEVFFGEREKELTDRRRVQMEDERQLSVPVVTRFMDESENALHKLTLAAKEKEQDAKRHRDELEEMTLKQEARIKDLTARVESLVQVVEELAAKVKEGDARRGR